MNAIETQDLRIWTSEPEVARLKLGIGKRGTVTCYDAQHLRALPTRFKLIACWKMGPWSAC